jgi:23S rRNA (guanosine2251-2'-O)-methyltransferase
MNQAPLLLYGIHSILEKLRAAPDDVEEILLTEDSLGGSARALHREAKRLGVRVSYASRAALDRLSQGQRHQGAVARIAPYGYFQIPDLLDEVSAPEFSGCVLALDGLTDPHNFGAILRTAEAVGVRHVVIPKDRSVDVTPVVMKTSAGAVHHLKVCKATNLRRVIAGLKARGFWVVGLCADAPEGIFDHLYPLKVCLVLGSEGGGIRPLIRSECDFQVAIPMLGKTASLNVSVAGAVFLYEWVRQRGMTADPASHPSRRKLDHGPS